MSQKPGLVLETITVWQSSTSCEPLKKLILYTIPKRGLLRQWLQDLQIAIARRQHGFVVPICPGTVQPSLRLKIGSRAKVVAWFHIGDGISYLGLSVKKDPSWNLGQAFDTHHFWTYPEGRWFYVGLPTPSSWVSIYCGFGYQSLCAFMLTADHLFIREHAPVQFACTAVHLQLTERWGKGV